MNPAAVKWIGQTVYDCASLVSIALKEHLNLRMVSGASSQWKGNHWDIKGTIGQLPKDFLVILYREDAKANPMQHTGIYLGDGMVVDARSTALGVVRTRLESYGWTHFAVPKGLYSGTDILRIEAEMVKGSIMKVLFKAIVIGGNLNLRRETSVASIRITQIPNGSSVEVLEMTSKDWWKISYGGSIGYVM